MLQMPAHATGKHKLLQITSLADQIPKPVAVGDARNVLFDNRSFVQDFRYIVASCADELDPSLKRGVIRLRPDKRRQKRMMHVDDLTRIAGNEFRRQYLHIAGQYDQFYLVLDRKSVV